MSFESLANELIFDVFEYLSFADLFHGFNNLNHRLDNLIMKYLENCRSIDFRLISKKNLNLFRCQYLPLCIDEIQTIYLSDDDRNPYEIDLFLSRLYPIYRFRNLKSLILSNLYSIEKLKRIINDLKEMTSLQSLKLKECYLENDPKKLVEIIDQIWSIANLKDCYFDFSFSSKSYFIVPTIVSCSIENLTIKGFQCSLEELAFLYEFTPNLKSVSIELTSSFDDDYSKLFLIPSLTNFNLKTSVSSDVIFSLLKKAPCLNCLTIQTKNIYIDGSKWQFIIQNYLCSLQTFHFQMEFSNENDEIEEEIDRIIKSYENPFWTDEHQWFVGCFSFKQNDVYVYNVHSLPYHFKHLNIYFNGNFHYKSTCTIDEQTLKYNYVQHLDYSCSITANVSLPKFEFENVNHLTLTIFAENYFQFVNYRCENLTSLSIRILDYFYDFQQINQIQSILDQSTNLSNLHFLSWPRILTKNANQNRKNMSSNDNATAPFNLRSSSIRCVNLRGVNDEGQKHCYNEQQCLTLIRSALVTQCEYLVIDVEKKSSIFDLIDKIKHLKTLNVSCREKNQNKDQIMKWLQSRLPTITLAKDSKHSDEIRLWTR